MLFMLNHAITCEFSTRICTHIPSDHCVIGDIARRLFYASSPPTIRPISRSSLGRAG